MEIGSGQKLPIKPPVTFPSTRCFNGISEASTSLQAKVTTDRQVSWMSFSPGLQPLLLVAYGTPVLDGLESLNGRELLRMQKLCCMC